MGERQVAQDVLSSAEACWKRPMNQYGRTIGPTSLTRYRIEDPYANYRPPAAQHA